MFVAAPVMMKFIAIVEEAPLPSFMQFIFLLLLAGMGSVTVTLDASCSSIVASVISDDKNDTSFGSLEKFLHLKQYK